MFIKTPLLCIIGTKWLLFLLYNSNLRAHGWKCQQRPGIFGVEISTGSKNRKGPIFSTPENTKPYIANKLSQIEKKWQEFWEREATFVANDDSLDKPKYYLLSMIPYPSGDGLHVGHLLGYTAIDAISRYKRMKGYEVLNPIGWDSFGLPAERYAKEVGRNVSEVTKENVENFKKQLKSMGYSYDWTREIDTSDSEYYKWTQWTFQQFYKHDLAYRSHELVNWCPELESVLANEEVRDGKSIRGSYDVYRKPMEQWMIRITRYAKRLLEDLRDLDWPQNLKVAQEKWIGAQEGFRVPFLLSNGHQVHAFVPSTSILKTCKRLEISMYERGILDACTGNYKENVERMIDASSKLTNLELYEKGNRASIFTGLYATNPHMPTKIPVYVTNALHGFSRDIEARVVGMDADNGTANADDDMDDHYNMEDAQYERITTFKFKDWIFSRQRSWGEPIPISNHGGSAGKCTLSPELPVLVTEDTTETMPQWAGSSWHYLRFVDPRNKDFIFDYEKAKRWLPVDLYIGGTEHSVSHLLYARFWNKVLYDLGISPCSEPFKKIVLHGTMNRAQYYDEHEREIPESLVTKYKGAFVLKSDLSTPVTVKAVKMSKSRHNTVKPDDLVETWSADALRLHLIFLGPIEKNKIWSDRAIKGVYRLLVKLMGFYGSIRLDKLADSEHTDIVGYTNGFITHITRCLETVQLNTSVQGFFKFLPEMQKWYRNGTLTLRVCNVFLLLLNPFAPHISEELWHRLNPGNDKISISQQPWPELLPRCQPKLPHS